MRVNLADIVWLVEPRLHDAGYRLYDLEFRSEGRIQVLCVMIDAPEGVGLDDCVKVTHMLDPLLEEVEVVPGGYTLEVSSPGIFRKLKTPEHFQQYTGHRIRIKLRQKSEQFSSSVGCLEGTTDQGIQFRPEKHDLLLNLSYEDIFKANLEPKL